MAFIVKKEKGTLILQDLGGYQTRNPSTFWCIQQADAIYQWPDFAPLKIHTHDFEQKRSDYTYSKSNSYRNLVPDFNFHAWPEVGITDYTNFVTQIDSAGTQPYSIHKVGWIGNVYTNPRRSQLLEIGNKNPELFDIFGMNWQGTPTKFISTPDLVATYSMLIDIEGNGYSGRLKHLLWSHRPVLLVDRPHKEFFYEHLKEWVHYIPVKRDLSDLIEKTKWCVDHYDEAKQIAENAYAFSKEWLTREACYKQWDTVIRSVSSTGMARPSFGRNMARARFYKRG